MKLSILYLVTLFSTLVSTLPSPRKRIQGNQDTCTWLEHCLGSTCNTFDDCSDALICTDGVCAVDNVVDPVKSTKPTTTIAKSTSTLKPTTMTSKSLTSKSITLKTTKHSTTFKSKSTTTSSLAPSPTISIIFEKPGLYFGVNAQKDIELTLPNLSINGHYPAMVGFYLGMNDSNDFVQNFKDFCDATKVAYSSVKVPMPIILLTIEPDSADVAFSSATVTSFASVAKSCNNFGLKLIIRFAPEFNIPDIPWYGNPTQYIVNFRAFATALKAQTSKSVMFWCPNIAYEGLPADTFDSYYPGDSFVDIVGLDLYYAGDDAGNNAVSSSDQFANNISGVNTNQPLWNFYARFAAAKNKPFVIGETSAFYHMGKPGSDQLAMKQSWWKQLFNVDTLQKFPLFRGVMWFNFYKFESNEYRDMRLFEEYVDGNPAVDARLLPAFINDIAGVPVVFAN